ncbi:MAG: hypothetical protein H7Z43_09200, partial [Clostridia bacterium]|nr:hypothetical protein [Deltaproteobacteria bacterium]
MRSIAFVLSLLVAGAAFANTALASTVRHAELKDLVAGSDIVARAHVVFVDDRAGQFEGKFRTRVGLEIDEAVKGLDGAATYELVLPGGKSGPYRMLI